MNTNQLSATFHQIQGHSGREVLYIKDVMKITGKSLRAAQKLHGIIKRKMCVRYLTIDAFCQYTGITPEAVIRNLE